MTKIDIFRAQRFGNINEIAYLCARYFFMKKMDGHKASSLKAIGEVGGPRCCKRDSYLAILSAIDFVKTHLGIKMTKPEVKCIHTSKNNQCIGKRCPFNAQIKTDYANTYSLYWQPLP